MSDDCDYQGYEFGANYLDSMCIDGYLWDADSCDEPGGPLTSGGEIPCPKCNHDCWLLDMGDEVLEAGNVAGYDREGVEKCPYPRPDAKYHKDSDGDVFRYCWLKGYWDGFSQRQLDDAKSPVTDHQESK